MWTYAIDCESMNSALYEYFTTEYISNTRAVKPQLPFRHPFLILKQYVNEMGFNVHIMHVK